MGCCSMRMILSILGSIALGIAYGLKVNLSVAIVSMVNHTYVKSLPTHGKPYDSPCNVTEESGKGAEDGPFKWSPDVQGLVLSSYFWGYMAIMLPAGRMAETLSARWVMFFSVAINVVSTLLSPLAAKLHVWLLIAMRVGNGIGGGVTFPGMHVMISRWCPPNERSMMSSIVYAGTSLGTVVMFLATGMIAGEWGWEAVFYIEGAACGIWLFFWVLLTSEYPDNHPFISQKEKDFILSSLSKTEGDAKHDLKVPWKAVWTSVPFWALIIAHFCSNWNFYLILLNLPLYMKNVLHYNIKDNAVATAVPYFVMWIFTMCLGSTLDFFRSRDMLSTTWARKIATLIASVIPMGCFIALLFVECERILATVLMGLMITTLGGMFCGFLCNHIDLAPNFAGTLVSITNCIATIGGIVGPNLLGEFLKRDPSIRSWRIIFVISIIMFAIEIVVYTIFGTGVEQEWNTPK